MDQCKHIAPQGVQRECVCVLSVRWLHQSAPRMPLILGKTTEKARLVLLHVVLQWSAYTIYHIIREGFMYWTERLLKSTWDPGTCIQMNHLIQIELWRFARLALQTFLCFCLRPPSIKPDSRTRWIFLYCLCHQLRCNLHSCLTSVFYSFFLNVFTFTLLRFLRFHVKHWLAPLLKCAIQIHLPGLKPS